MSHRMLCITALVALFTWSSLKCDPIITLPYPSDIASTLKNEGQKKIDLADVDFLTQVTFEDLFNDAETKKIVIAGVATKEQDKLIIHYFDALNLINYFFSKLDGVAKPKILTQDNYNWLKRNQYHADENPTNKQRIQNVYFFTINRSGESSNYSYATNYIGNLTDIVKKTADIADLETAIINNSTPDINNDGSKKFATLNEQKIALLKKIMGEYKNKNETTIAQYLEQQIKKLEETKLSPEEEEKLKKEDEQRKAKEELQKKSLEKGAKLLSALQKILRAISNRAIVTIFESEVAPLANDEPVVKPKASDFTTIIDSYFRLNLPQDAYTFIVNKKSSIEGYNNDQVTVTENLYADFIHAIDARLKLPNEVLNLDEKQNFIDTLSKTKVTESYLQEAINAMVEGGRATIEKRKKLEKVIQEIKQKLQDLSMTAPDAEKLFTEHIKPFLTAQKEIKNTKEIFTSIIKRYAYVDPAAANAFITKNKDIVRWLDPDANVAEMETYLINQIDLNVQALLQTLRRTDDDTRMNNYIAKLETFVTANTTLSNIISAYKREVPLIKKEREEKEKLQKAEDIIEKIARELSTSMTAEQADKLFTENIGTIVVAKRLTNRQAATFNNIIREYALSDPEAASKFIAKLVSIFIRFPDYMSKYRAEEYLVKEIKSHFKKLTEDQQATGNDAPVNDYIAKLKIITNRASSKMEDTQQWAIENMISAWEKEEETRKQKRQEADKALLSLRHALATIS